MASELSYDEYTKLQQTVEIRQHFTNQQWRCINKLVRRENLSVEDRRALCKAGILDKQQELTLRGRVYTNKINKKRQAKKSKTKVSRRKLSWEMEEA